MLNIGDRMRVSAELLRLFQKGDGRSEVCELVEVLPEPDGTKVLLLRTPDDPVSRQQRYAEFRAHREYCDIPGRLDRWQSDERIRAFEREAVERLRNYSILDRCAERSAGGDA